MQNLNQKLFYVMLYLLNCLSAANKVLAQSESNYTFSDGPPENGNSLCPQNNRDNFCIQGAVFDRSDDLVGQWVRIISYIPDEDNTGLPLAREMAKCLTYSAVTEKVINPAYHLDDLIKSASQCHFLPFDWRLVQMMGKIIPGEKGIGLSEAACTYAQDLFSDLQIQCQNEISDKEWLTGVIIGAVLGTLFLAGIAAYCLKNGVCDSRRLSCFSWRPSNPFRSTYGSTEPDAPRSRFNLCR